MAARGELLAQTRKPRKPVPAARLRTSPTAVSALHHRLQYVQVGKEQVGPHLLSLGPPPFEPIVRDEQGMVTPGWLEWPLSEKTSGGDMHAQRLKPRRFRLDLSFRKRRLCGRRALR